MTLPEVWTPEQLKGKRASETKPDPLLWGRPGHLTEEECDIFVSAIFGVTNSFRVQCVCVCVCVCFAARESRAVVSESSR